jgi:hypothetical protein
MMGSIREQPEPEPEPELNGEGDREEQRIGSQKKKRRKPDQ